MPGNLVPMDINVVRKAKALPDACQCCGKTGHWAKDCECHFNIHFMDDGEIQKQLENRLAARDITKVSAKKDNEVLDSIDLEDFVLCSSMNCTSLLLSNNQISVLDLHEPEIDKDISDTSKLIEPTSKQLPSSSEIPHTTH